MLLDILLHPAVPAVLLVRFLQCYVFVEAIVQILEKITSLYSVLGDLSNWEGYSKDHGGMLVSTF